LRFNATISRKFCGLFRNFRRNRLAEGEIMATFAGMKKTYIHEREDWTDFHWDSNRLINIMSRVNRETGYLAGRLSAIGFDAQLNTAAETLANDIVASSAIEGIILDMSEVRSSVARRLGVAIVNEMASTHYVDGIVEMMLDATVNYQAPLTQQRLFAWHAALFPTGRSGLDEIHVGSYRTQAMQVVSGAFGRERVHYRAPQADRVPAEMIHFLNWLNDDGNEPSYIKSAIAHLWFVSIHPFDDGNGRVARAISDMILAQTEHNGRRFYSVSSEINREKSSYYDVLERTQQGDGDITQWLQWYLTCIANAVKAADTMLSGVLRKTIFWRTHAGKVLSLRQKQVLNTYLDGYDAKLTIKNYAKLCQVSTDTAAHDIHDLEAKGIVRAEQGRVRDVSYSLTYVDEQHNYDQLALQDEGGKTHIVATLPDGRTIQEQITNVDKLRYNQEELTLQDLADKYFSFIKL